MKTKEEILKKLNELVEDIKNLAEPVAEPSEWTIQDIKEKHLEWGNSSEEEMNWEDAKKWCENQGGRLPTIVELMEAYHGGIEGFTKDYYWFSSEYSSAYPFSLSFSNGSVYTNTAKSIAFYVRCVRGRQIILL